MKKLLLSTALIFSTFINIGVLASASLIAPENIILQVGSDETERMFAWYSNQKAEGSKAYISRNADMSEATELTAEITASKTGTFGYSAKATDLEQNTDYYYQVYCGSTGSEIYSFTTTDVEAELNFLVVGDTQFGTYNLSGLTNAWVTSISNGIAKFPETDFVLSMGDQVDNPSNEAEYDAFTTPEQVRKFPVAVTVGNHDVNSDIYSAHFAVPNVSGYGSTVSKTGVDGANSYFVQGDVLFMNLNTNSSLSEANHAQFMQETMSAVPHEWAIVYTHYAPYSAGSHAKDPIVYSMRDSLVPVFSQLGVDVVFTGHDHVYTRSHLMNGANPVIPSEPAKSGDILMPKEGEVLYITANSTSGSKYYGLHNELSSFNYVAVANQEYVPNISNVIITDDSIKISTFRSNSVDMSLVDEVTIAKEEATELAENEEEEPVTRYRYNIMVAIMLDLYLSSI